MHRTLRAISTLLLVISLLGFTPAYAADKWISIRSKNFLLVGNASETAIRRVGRNLEEFRAGFSLLFPAIGQQAPPPITVVVFKDDASFRPFKPLYQGKPGNMAGFFQAGQDVNFIAMAGDTPTPHVIYHEFVHSLTKDGTVPLPPWASEGLAEFYGMFEIEANGKEMMVGRPMSDHVLTLRQTFMPVETLVGVQRGSPYYNEQQKQGIFYAESWATIHYLMLGNNLKRQPQLGKFLSLLGSGKSTAESFSEAFETDYKSFESDLRDYISRYSFPVIRYKLQDKIDFDREMQVSPLTEAQAQYYLGDLLLHIGRLETAETLFQKAISLDRSFAPSYASMGMLKVRQDKREEALKFLTQAVQADSKDYMAHYYYAYMLQTNASSSSASDHSRYELMREHLKKAIELSPSYLNTYGMLGYVALMLHDELPQTEDLLKKALNSSPGRQDIRMRLAELMIANKELLAARAIVRPLTVSDDDVMKNHAQSLLDEIQQFMDNEEALRQYEERRREAEAAATAAAAARALTPDSTFETDEPPKIARTPTKTSPDGSTIETAAPQIKRPAGAQIQGGLIAADCTHGLTLKVRIGNGNVELHSDDPSTVEFISFTASVKNDFACGTFKAEMPVLIVYKKGSDPRYLGEPLRVEFTDKK
jgi:tetratricopeptide (TPR) repeat protein